MSEKKSETAGLEQQFQGMSERKRETLALTHEYLMPNRVEMWLAAGIPLVIGKREGYRAVRRLPDEQLAMMPTFLMARGLSYLGWPAGRPEIGSVREMLPFLVEDTTALARQYLEQS